MAANLKLILLSKELDRELALKNLLRFGCYSYNSSYTYPLTHKRKFVPAIIYTLLTPKPVTAFSFVEARPINILYINKI